MQGDVELSRAIGRIEGKLDAIHEDVRDLQPRVDELEAKHDKQKGALAVLGVIAGIVGSIVTFIVKGL